MLIFIIKLGLLLVSYIGWWEFCKERLGVNRYFAPLVTIALQFMILFVAGLLNYLQEVTVGMYICGIFMFLYYLRSKKWRLITEYVNWGYIAFFVIFGILFVYLRGKMFTHVDNFTHWALVVKNMLHSNRFPTVLDKAVTFKSYPLGSASIIYYFTKLTRDEECIMMAAQAYMMLCTILPVFAYVKKHRGLCTALIVAMTVMLFNYNIPLDSLLVDTLMPLVGAATVLYTDHEYLRKEKINPAARYILIALLFWVINIKDAGAFYVVVIFAIILLECGMNKEKLKQILTMGLVLLSGKSLWKHHCNYVFGTMKNSMHVVSLSRYTKVFSEKSPEYFLKTIKGVIQYSFTRAELLALLTWLVVIGVLIWNFQKDQRRKVIKTAAFMIVTYVTYVLCVLGIFLFSMPEYEGLAGLGRYAKTIDVAFYLMLMVFMVSFISATQERALRIMGAIFSVVASLYIGIVYNYESSGALTVHCTVEEREKIEMPIWEYGVSPEWSYLILGDLRPEVQVFQKYIWIYHMRTTEVNVMAVTDTTQLDVEAEYDYVIILDEDNPIITSWLQKKYPEHEGKTVIQHFN